MLLFSIAFSVAAALQAVQAVQAVQQPWTSLAQNDLGVIPAGSEYTVLSPKVILPSLNS